MDLQKLAKALDAQSGNPVCADAIAQWEMLIKSFDGLGQDWARAAISVVMPDGRWFIGASVTEVFVKAIEAIGPERVAEVKPKSLNQPLVTKNPQEQSEEYTVHKIAGGWQVCTQYDTESKVKLLKEIGIGLGMTGLKVAAVADRGKEIRRVVGFRLAKDDSVLKDGEGTAIADDVIAIKLPGCEMV